MTAPVEFAPVAGRPWQLASDLTLVLAPNHSPMTGLGTNTFLLGSETLALIDPGPDIPAHLKALLAAINGRPVSHIFVTHSHRDHSPLARTLSEKTGAAIYAFGDSQSGRSAAMQALSNNGLAGGGEGVDPDFKPDYLLKDAECVTGNWGALTALHTPGHMGNHMCFQWGTALFSGDHVMGWASSLVSPPDGDLTDFMASCEELRALDAKIFYPAHGAPISDPKARLEWLINHRRGREAQILAALRNGPATPRELADNIYVDTAHDLRAAAERNVFAHLVDLLKRNEIAVVGPLSALSTFRKLPV
jgi:glyoxylase-like metal-dependent hydrolase (beta-lactamase superfamily II)